MFAVRPTVTCKRKSIWFASGKTLPVRRPVAARVQADKSPALMKALDVPKAAPAEQRQAVINQLQQNVQAMIGLNTRIAQVEFTSRNSVASAVIANAYADALAAANVNYKVAAANKAKVYLIGQLTQAKGRLEGSERQMLSYARAADLTTTIAAASTNADQPSLRAQQVGLMTDSLSQATARRIDAEQQWAQVRGTSALQLPDVQNNGAIQDLYSQKAQLEATLQQDRQRYTDSYPSVRENAAKIGQLDAQIGALAANIKSSFYGRYVAAAQQERQLAGTVGGLRGAAMAERERSVGYNSLKREVETNKAFYDGLLQRYKEIAAAYGAPSTNVSVVDRAYPPLNPSSPNVPWNMALAGLSGLILALLAGLAREGRNRFVRSAEDIESTFNLPSLGVIPIQHGQKATDFRLTDWRSTQAEAYHSIAVALEQAASGRLPKSLLITSSSVAEGKSTTSVGIARSLAAMGRNVLLIDGDLRHPSLGSFTGQEDGPGLTDLLIGSATPHDVIQRDDERGFDIVTAGRAHASPVALLADRQVREVLRGLSDDYDIVIVDGPPVMGLADAVLLARSVESILVVVESNRIHWSQIDLALARLPANEIIGSVITKFNAKAAGVRYGDTNYYSY